MPAWWSRLVSSPRALALTGGAVVAAAAVAIAVIATATGGNGDDGPDTPGDQQPAASSSRPTTTPATALPPDQDKYCAAYASIIAGGFKPAAGDDGHVDLSELGRKFDELIGKYSRAERISPVSLRDDYALALGYLREGRKAVKSRDLDRIKALVSNLNTLNDSMDAIEGKSRTYCR